MTRLARRIRSAVLAALLAFPLLSCGDSPAEPGKGGGLLLVTALTTPTLSESGVLTVEAAACLCVAGPLLVDVNGSRVGTTPCAGRQDFATPKVDPASPRVLVRVTDASGATGLLEWSTPPPASGAPSLTVRVLCP